MIRTAIFDVAPDFPDIRDCTVLVRCPDGEAAARGLWAARARLWYATAEGEEITEDDVRHGDGSDRFTPNWVSPVLRSELGPALWLDTGSWAPAEMADLMRRIVVEELARAGVTDADLTSFPADWSPSSEEWR